MKISTPAPSPAGPLARGASRQDAGVDTVSYAFRPAGRKGDELLAQLRTRQGREGPASSIIHSDGPGGARVIAFPGVVAVEGRLGALLTGSEGEHGLWGASALAEGADAARAAVARLIEGGEIAPLGAAEVRRLDLAAELRFDDGGDGLALLDALAGMSAPRRKVVAWRKGAAPQTVYWVTERGRVMQRAYDKGVEAGTHRAGERIRLELQHRPPKGRRKRPEVVAAEDLSTLYMGALDGFDRSAPTARGEGEHIAAVLLDRVRRGDLSARKCASLVGYMTMLRAGGEDVLSDQSYRYHLRELSAAGIVLDRPRVEREVNVAGHLAELRSRFAA